MGMELADDGEPDRCYLRMDYWHHRIVMHQRASDDLANMGFRVAGGEEFREMQRQLADAGINFRVGSNEEAAERHVLELMKLKDPGGNPIEIFHGPELQYDKPFHSGRRMHGRFKTGPPDSDTVSSARTIPMPPNFYAVLGMRGGVEYKMRMGKQVAEPIFMHCNERDHTLAFGIGGGGPMP